MFQEHDMVTMKRSVEGIPVGTVGTIVNVYKEGLAYEVEFPTKTVEEPPTLISVDKADISPMPNRARRRSMARG